MCLINIHTSYEINSTDRYFSPVASARPIIPREVNLWISPARLDRFHKGINGGIYGNSSFSLSSPPLLGASPREEQRARRVWNIFYTIIVFTRRGPSGNMDTDGGVSRAGP